MSDRWDKFKALETRLQEISDVTVETWDGVDNAFNDDKVYPYVAVAYYAKRGKPNLQIPGAVIGVSYVYYIYVATDDQEEAMDLMDSIDEKLLGWELPNEMGKIDISNMLNFEVAESLVEAHDGKYLYAQAFQVDDVEDYEQ